TAILIAIALFRPIFGTSPASLRSALVTIALVGWGLTLVLVVFGPRLLPRQDEVRVDSPVRGRWLAMNSPASRVPSHGVRMYGQTYAIDLVHEPDRTSRPVFGTAGAMRPNGDYPAF